MTERVKLEDIKWDTSLAEIANALLKHGTAKRAAKGISCSPVYLREKVKGEWVYFYALEDRVKIGHTADLITRTQSFLLHTGGAGKYMLLVAGSAGDEDRIQRDLSEYRITGEWFFLNDEVRNYMGGL